MEIIQANRKESDTFRRDVNAIDVTISTNENGAFLKVYFGANVKHAKMYVLGYEKVTPVLVPVKQDGYRVNDSHQNGAGTMRFKLADDSLDIFGREIATKVRENIEWETELIRRIHKNENTDDMGHDTPYGDIELTGYIDNELYVWIEL